MSIVNKSLSRKLSYRKDDRAMRPIYGCPENFRVPEYATTPTATFPEIFNGFLTVPIDYMNVRTKFEVRIALDLPVPEIIAIGLLDGGCELANPQSWGSGGRMGSDMVPFERALVSFYRPSRVTFLYLYVFQRYCRCCAPALHFFPTPPLVSPKFSHVPLGVGH